MKLKYWHLHDHAVFNLNIKLNNAFRSCIYILLSLVLLLNLSKCHLKIFSIMPTFMIAMHVSVLRGFLKALIKSSVKLKITSVVITVFPTFCGGIW